jgi:hypothetical protein
MKHSTFISTFISLYGDLNRSNLHRLPEIYSNDIQFVDAIHQINGLPQLTRYFEHLYENILDCKFNIHNVIESDNEASLFWTMEYSHPKIGKGKVISVDGTSHIKFNETVYYHRDYLDMGQMLYEHLPVLGSAIRLIKKRMQS